MSKHIYTEEQKEFIKNNYKGTSHRKMAELLHDNFGITLTVAKIKSYYGNNKLNSGLTGQFKKGNIPYNKGKKMSPYVYKKANPTMFKKGNVPRNRREIGDERIDSKDGYTYVKIQDGQLNKNWILKHRMIWEQEYGQIPEGHNLIFKDGDRRNIILDNLMLVSKAEDLTMNRQGLFSKNSEITETGVLIAKVISKANKIKKEKWR